MKPVHVSTMTGKLKGIRAINTDTTSNPFCQKMQKTNAICKECYSQRMLTSFRKCCVTPFRKNSELLSSRILTKEELPHFVGPVVRFSAHGEVINDTHFINLCNIAAHNPHVTIGWWTKRKDIVSRLRHLVPANVVLIYSEPYVDVPNQVVPEGFEKVFSVYSENSQVGARINCHGGCITCRKCYAHNGIAVINETLK
jgi:hypothetical protein